MDTKHSFTADAFSERLSFTLAKEGISVQRSERVAKVNQTIQRLLEQGHLKRQVFGVSSKSDFHERFEVKK